ncbi:DNA protecting protein DprA [Sporocytophaga myxococcoides]|uniref:DNA protecting protein DprA n=1 Tax=Sporocytophaga myxococcoides TaxID=153721 RepID=A0A098LFX3_9BACT|nr:DNA-processing protein DprA [Sporocytophaga myxococcoides]GAL84998.1 DNA protecting protein DprA [Sporocytophaga myxococcoides]
MTHANVYEVAIGLVPGIGNQLTRQLVSYCGDPEQVFREKKGKLLKIPGIGENIAQSIIQSDIFSKAEKQVEMAIKTGTKILFYTNHDYPERLKTISDAPTLIYYKGQGPVNFPKTVGIVGTRNATGYGKEMTEKIISELKSQNIQIISGLAYGIDSYAHKSALDNGLSTIGVMATGVNIVYPAVHKEMANRMQTSGGILSEYPFDTKPEPGYFPARNRIIAGLSDIVIVVEASNSGGALITAELANGYNREVMAVPGNINNKYSVGCNNLIKSHKAQIYSKTSDIIELMNWDLSVLTKPKNKTREIPEGLTNDEKKIFELLISNGETHIDELCWKSQIPVSKMASLLLNLEFNNQIKSLPGKKYKLV